MEAKAADDPRRSSRLNLREMDLPDVQLAPVPQLPAPTKFRRADKDSTVREGSEASNIRLQCKKIHHRQIGQKILDSNEGAYSNETNIWSSVFIQNLNHLI